MTRPPRDALRREILVVAQRMFSTAGFRGTSLQMIADEVPCSKAALLYHFRSKAALLEALVSDLLTDLGRMHEQLLAVPADETVARTLELGVALVVRHRAALATLRGLDEVDGLHAFSEQGRAWAEEMRLRLVGPDPGPLEQVAALTFENGLLGACLALPDLDDGVLADCLLRIGARVFALDPQQLTAPS